MRLLRRHRTERHRTHRHLDREVGADGGPAAPVAVPETPEQLLLRLEHRVLRRLDGILQGDHRTLLYGSGVDFADLREYQPNDDVRRIDWNVTARLDTPFVRTFHEDREVTAWFLVDRSASMRFGTTGRSKEVVVAEFVTAMARLATRHGDRVGALLYDNSVHRVIEPGTGRHQVLRMARELLRPVTASADTTDLAGLFVAASSRLRRRSLVFVVSDFQSDSGWQDRLRWLARRHDVVAIRPVDPREQELPDNGVVMVRDAETGEQLTIDTADPHFRLRHAEASLAREADLASAMRHCGVDMVTMPTNGDLVDALVAMSKMRSKRRR